MPGAAGRHVGSAKQVIALLGRISGAAPFALFQRGVPALDELFDLLVFHLGQGIHAFSRISAFWPGVGPRRQQEAALIAGAAHQAIYSGAYALAARVVTALVQAIEQEEGTLLACQALQSLRRVVRQQCRFNSATLL